MAEIVLGLATSHGPMLVTETSYWSARIVADKAASHAWRRKRWSFDELVEARRDERLNERSTPEAMQAHQQRCNAALDALAKTYADARIDVAVIIGNDQKELFRADLNPAIAIFHGETITNYEFPPQRLAELPPGIEKSLPGYIPSGGATYAGHPDLAGAIIAQNLDDGFDISTMETLPRPETPHAFGFVYRRLMHDAPPPSVPVLINTFYPPNQPRVSRCYALGQSIARAIKAWKSDARVALIASGGLTHFVIDESVDQILLRALETKDRAAIEALGEDIMQDGTSELKNWIVLAGAMAELELSAKVIDYVPCYRSAAGTGNAMGFVQWQ